MKKKRNLLILLPFLLILIILTSCSSQQNKQYHANKKLGPQINYTVTGIDASSGEMTKAKKMLDVYDLKEKNWQLMPSSTAAMASTLGKAIDDKKPIVVTAFQPHWMFAKYKLKFLKDPKNVFGETQHFSTVARTGLKKDNPGAYQLLQNFHWTIDDSYSTMLKINNGMNADKAAKQYLKDHPKKVASILQDVPQGHGEKIKLVYTPYDYESAVTHVVKGLLNKKGYKATTQQLDVSIMWQALSSGQVDVTLVAQLPVSHGAYAKKYQGKVDEVRVNLKNAKIGLAVPTYMKDINSINDLKNK